jgi:5-methylcytosine-specific restriction endonuclease McrA
MVILRQWAWTYWRPAIFARDCCTCQHCGDNRGGNLHAHHIEPFARLVTRKKQAWTLPLSTPEERLAFATSLLADPEITTLSNGITLCMSCHQKIHKKLQAAL